MGNDAIDSVERVVCCILTVLLCSSSTIAEGFTYYSLTHVLCLWLNPLNKSVPTALYSHINELTMRSMTPLCRGYYFVLTIRVVQILLTYKNNGVTQPSPSRWRYRNECFKYDRQHPVLDGKSFFCKRFSNFLLIWRKPTGLESHVRTEHLWKLFSYLQRKIVLCFSKSSSTRNKTKCSQSNIVDNGKGLIPFDWKTNSPQIYYFYRSKPN